MEFQELTEQYRNELRHNIIPFWEKYAFDPMYGGVFEAVDEGGSVLSTDKPLVLQGQAAWAFAFAHTHLGPVPTWIDRAVQTGSFFLAKGRDAKGNWLATVDRRGLPLENASTPVPALYGILALGQLFESTHEAHYAETARKSLVQLFKKREAALARQKQAGTPGRAFKSLEEFALLGQVLLTSQSYMDQKWHKKAMDAYVQELTEDFYDKRTDILLENVTPEGHFWDCPAGRAIVPGRVFEMAGFMMGIADRSRNRKLLNQMLDLTELTLNAAWDETHGGYYYQLDLKSLPSLEARWNHKMAWVHLEALQTLLKAHLLSARPVFLEMFEKTHAYVWLHFPDSKQGEWFGELSREGQPAVRHKITPQKGCYSLVKNLTQIAGLLEVAAGLADRTDSSTARTPKQKARKP